MRSVGLPKTPPPKKEAGGLACWPFRANRDGVEVSPQPYVQFQLSPLAAIGCR
jgi:hypothetical protein